MKDNLKWRKQWSRYSVPLYIIITAAFVAIIFIYFPGRAFGSAPSTVDAYGVSGRVDLSGKLGEDVEEIYNLEGEWKFYPGQLYTGTQLNSLPETEGYLVEYPHYWKDDAGMPVVGYGTYVMDITVPGDFTNIGIYSRYQFSAFDIYIDDSYVCGGGVVDENEENYRPNFMPASGYIEHGTQTGQKQIRLIVQVQNEVHNSAGLNKTLYIGSRESIMKLQSVLLFFNGLFSGGLLLLYLCFILIYLHNRERKEYLDYSIVALMALYLSLTNAGEALLYKVTDQIISPTFTILFMRTEYAALVVGALFANYGILMKYLAHRKNAMRVLIGSVCAILLFQLVSPPLLLTRLPAINMALAASLFLIPVGMSVADAVRRKSLRPLISLLSCAMIFVGMALYVSGVYPWQSIDLFSVSVIIHCILQMWIFLRGYGQIERELKQLTETLEVRIVERTEELEEMAQRAEAATAAKSTFLATMSHEIRTPMNAIIGMSDLMRSDNLDDVQQRYFNDIKKTSKALLHIINDILDFSKIEAGKLDLLPVHFNLVSMYDNICSICYFQAAAKDLSFHASFASNVPEIIFADEIRYRQMLLNILNNAIKYTRQGNVEFRVDKSEYEGQECIVFTVKDTGVGIKPEDLDSIFETFQQLDSASNRSIIGTGLGLAITKSLVEMMGGQIFCESQYGEGSVFTICLPLVRGERDKMEIPDDTANVWATPETKVLVVDDNSINLTVAVGFLAKHGISADTAISGYEAIEKMEKTRYDIVFMDHMMPEMDGVETTRRIRKSSVDYMRVVPVIALTANAVMGIQELFTSAGMDDFVSKPIVASRLNAVLAKWLPPERISSVGSAESTSEGTPQQEELIKQLDEIEGLNVEHALERIANSHKIYITVLRQFCAEADSFCEKLLLDIANENWPSYIIQIHGLKGVLANLGADTLSQKAYLLECAGRNEEYAECISQTGALLDQVLELRGNILKTPIIQTENENKEIMGRTHLEKLLSQLCSNLQVGQSDAAEELLESIGSYNEEIDPMLQEIKALVISFDYEMAIEKCAQVIKLL